MGKIEGNFLFFFFQENGIIIEVICDCWVEGGKRLDIWDVYVIYLGYGIRGFSLAS